MRSQGVIEFSTMSNGCTLERAEIFLKNLCSWKTACLLCYDVGWTST
jgi:hypothetical protein